MTMKPLAILKKDLFLLLRDRGQLFALFLTPLLFILFLGYILPEDGFDEDADVKPQLLVVNYDQTPGADGGEMVDGIHAQELLDFLLETFAIETDFPPSTAQQLGVVDAAACNQAGPACDELIATTLVEQSERDTALVIPAGFSADIDAGRRVTMTLYYDPVGDSIRRQINEAVIQGGAIQQSLQSQVFAEPGFEQLEDLLTYAPEDIQDFVATKRAEAVEQEPALAVEAVEQEPALAVVSIQPSNFTLKQRPDTYQQTVPGFTVMYVFFLIPFLSSLIRAEQNSGTFRRLLNMPVSRSQLLAGKLFSALTVGLVQVTIMFAVGHFLFGLGLGQDPLALILLTVALVMSAATIGLAAAAFNLESVLTVPLIVAALISGCMIPVDWLPQFVRSIAHAVPHFWAMSGYQDILVRGQGLLQVLPAIGMLLSFAIVFFIIAVRQLDFE